MVNFLCLLKYKKADRGSAFQSVDKPYTSRIGLLNLSRPATLPFSPSGAELNEPSTARTRF